nr:universal stress protein A-like protein protein [Pomacea canaliculata]
MEYYSVSLLKIGLLGSSAKMIFDRLNRVRKYCINRNSGLCFILLNVRNGARSGTVIPSISAVYVFDREVLEAMLKDEQQRIQKDLEKFADKLKSYGLGGKVKSVAAAKPGEGIIKECGSDVGLVVVGSRGLGAVRRTILGSVSDYVVHHSKCPVIVVKHDHHGHHEQQKKD